MKNSPPRKRGYIVRTTCFKLKRILRNHAKDRLAHGFYTLKTIWRRLLSAMYIKEIIASAFGRFKYL